jgi:hypothetical protein
MTAGRIRSRMTGATADARPWLPVRRRMIVPALRVRTPAACTAPFAAETTRYTGNRHDRMRTSQPAHVTIRRLARSARSPAYLDSPIAAPNDRKPRGYRKDHRDASRPVAPGQLNMRPPGLHIYASRSCTENARTCRRQGLPGLPWCAGVPVRRACRTEAVPLAVELIEGHGAGGKREPGCDARMPPGSRTALRDGRAAGRTPVNVAAEPAGAVPGRRGTGRCGCPVRRARSCYHAE